MPPILDAGSICNLIISIDISKSSTTWERCELSASKTQKLFTRGNLSVWLLKRGEGCSE